VANTLGALGRPAGIKTLLKLLEDEDPDVRRSALRSLGKVGITQEQDSERRVTEYLQSTEIPEQVWAAQALLKGGDTTHEKFLITLVKEEPRLLTDMGELGEVLADLGLVESVPFCISRLKHEKAEFRADAAEALGKITGLDLEYQSLDSPEQRRTAIKAYSRWWEQKKRERRAARGR
jgi:HEAT repeat protein